MKKLVCGVGNNDADYAVNIRIGGKRGMCPAYRAWTSMLNRVYNSKFHERQPTYIDTNVCEAWKSFMNFRVWWLDHYVVGYQLDKDIISDDNLYSPETCIYIPSWLNKFTTNSGAARGELPVGVSYHKPSGKYAAQCSHPFGEYEYLGYYSDAEQAHQAWRNRKLKIAAELKSKMDDIDVRIYPRIIEIISNSK